MAATLKHKVENLCKAATTSSDGGSELVKYLQDSNTTNLGLFFFVRPCAFPL